MDILLLRWFGHRGKLCLRDQWERFSAWSGDAVPSTDNWTLNRNQYSHLLPNHPNEVFSKEWPASGLWQDDKLWIVRKKNASRSLSIILYYTRDYTVGRCATNSEVSARPPSHPFSLLLHHVWRVRYRCVPNGGRIRNNAIAISLIQLQAPMIGC